MVFNLILNEQLGKNKSSSFDFLPNYAEIFFKCFLLLYIVFHLSENNLRNDEIVS